jgi:hypothetical protein
VLVTDDDGLDRENILGGAFRRSRLVHWLSLSAGVRSGDASNSEFIASSVFAAYFDG